MSATPSLDSIRQLLATIHYPATRQDILSSGIVKDNIQISENTVSITLTPPRKPDPHIQSIARTIERQLADQFSPNYKIQVNIQYPTPQAPAEQPFANIKNIIAISSGKGGVGKSTIAANLAIALQRLGNTVALLDTDLFGPSIPRIFNLQNQQPEATEQSGRLRIQPIYQYGIALMSLGFFISEGSATLWRGAMATNMLRQLLSDTNWGTLDYLILDTPPGTSDIHLTLLQTLPITAAIIVSTPQNIALDDARRGIDMYQNPKVGVPILGLIENMAYFIPPDNPSKHYYIFGKDGCKNLARQLNVPLIAQLPIEESLCQTCEQGQPIALSNTSNTALLFLEMAQTVITLTRKRNREAPPSHPVTTH